MSQSKGKKSKIVKKRKSVQIVPVSPTSIALYNPVELLAETTDRKIILETLPSLLFGEEDAAQQLQNVDPTVLDAMGNTFFKPSLKTILRYLRNFGESLSYPVIAVRSSSVQRDRAEYVLRRTLFAKLVANPNISLKRLQEEFGRLSNPFDSDSELLHKSKGIRDYIQTRRANEVYYNVFAEIGNSRLYTGFVRTYKHKLGDSYQLVREEIVEAFHLKDNAVIAHLGVDSEYNPHPFEKTPHFYDELGIDTSEADNRLIAQIVDDLFSLPVTAMRVHGLPYRIDSLRRTLDELGFSEYTRGNFIKIRDTKKSGKSYRSNTV